MLVPKLTQNNNFTVAELELILGGLRSEMRRYDKASKRASFSSTRREASHAHAVKILELIHKVQAMFPDPEF